MVYGLFLSLFFPRAKPLAYKTKLADEGNGKIHLWGQYVCLSSIKISTFSRSINQFSEISRSFFQNIDRGLKLRLNTLSLAHKNLLRIFFQKFYFFKVKKSILKILWSIFLNCLNMKCFVLWYATSL